MLVITTFSLPNAAAGGFFCLLVPRDTPSTTLKGGLNSLAAFFVSMAFVLLGAILLVDYPLTHFLWVIGSFFIAFFGISAISNYGSATAFAIAIVLSIPVWDQPGAQSLLVIANLWTAGSVAVAILATILVEYAFALFNPRDPLTVGLTERVDAVCVALHQAAQGEVDQAAKAKLSQFAVVGTSRLRRLALNANASRHEIARLSTTVSLVGRLVDVLAAYRHWDELKGEGPRVQALADEIRTIEKKLQAPPKDEVVPQSAEETGGPLILLALEQTAALLRVSLSPDAGQGFTLDAATPQDPPILKPDSFSNPEHLQFALRGCFASVLCYFLFNAVFWPGLSTSLFTCVVTALTSIGTSRQKQLLRISGAICGGLIFGMGSQVFILPVLDTFTGFAVLFVTVTVIAAWFITASPRLSYFGTQLALAFYLIQLRGAFPQTNLALARDNVMGILLGLVVMWLVFETLGSKPAVVVMREIFAENLKLLAQLARPWTGGRAADLKMIRTIRDRISQNFTSVNAQADAVLFETGRSRARNLATRERLLGWQPELRSLFLMEVASLQQRLQVAPTDIPRAVLDASQGFDDEVARLFQAMSRAFSTGERRYQPAGMQTAYDRLADAMHQSYGDQPTIRSRAVLSIAGQIVEVATRLFDEMKKAR